MDRYFMINGGFPVCMKGTADGGLSIMAWDRESKTLKRAPKYTSYVTLGVDSFGDTADVDEVTEEEFNARVSKLAELKR